MSDHFSELPYELMAQQVTEAAVSYAEAHTTARSAAVVAVAEETATATALAPMLGGGVEARLLECLMVVARARRVLEIGTFTGATALALAEVLPHDGRITTIEVNDEYAQIARRHLDASPHGDKVEVLVGDALEIVAGLSGPYDLVFVDAWKRDYVDYYELVIDRLAPGGVIAVDNVVWYGLPFHSSANDSETEGVRRFVNHVQQDPRTHNALLTVGDGLMLIWRTPETTQP